MKLDISLYIPVYNGESTIERVLKSALKLDPGPNEIIVVNDGSTDDTLKILNKYKNEIKIINNIENKGLAYSRNIGIEKALNENVASIDSDVEVSSTWLKELNDTKNKFNSAMSGSKLIEKLKDENIYNMWRHIYATQNSFGNIDIGNLGRPLSGSNTLLSKSVWREIGGYEIQYKTNGEDSNFCQKLLNLNYKTSYCSQAKCYHLRNDNLKSLLDASRRGYISGAGLKKPTLMRFMQRSIRHTKGYLKNAVKDVVKLRFAMMYVGFRICWNHINKEFIGLIKNKSNYV